MMARPLRMESCHSLGPHFALLGRSQPGSSVVVENVPRAMAIRHGLHLRNPQPPSFQQRTVRGVVRSKLRCRALPWQQLPRRLARLLPSCPEARRWQASAILPGHRDRMACRTEWPLVALGAVHQFSAGRRHEVSKKRQRAVAALYSHLPETIQRLECGNGSVVNRSSNFSSILLIWIGVRICNPYYLFPW